MKQTAASMIRDWTNTVDTSTEIVSDAVAPALLDFLLSAAWYPIQVGMTYAQPALMFDGTDNTAASGTSLEARRIAIMAPPAVLNARAWIVRCGDDDQTVGVVQTATTIETTSSGGIGGAAADVITVVSKVYGADGYFDTETEPVGVVMWQTADSVENSPGATQDRQIELPEALAPAVEQIEIEYCNGFGLLVTTRTGDLDTL